MRLLRGDTTPSAPECRTPLSDIDSPAARSMLNNKLDLVAPTSIVGGAKRLWLVPTPPGAARLAAYASRPSSTTEMALPLSRQRRRKILGWNQQNERQTPIITAAFSPCARQSCCSRSPEAISARLPKRALRERWDGDAVSQRTVQPTLTVGVAAINQGIHEPLRREEAAWYRAPNARAMAAAAAATSSGVGRQIPSLSHSSAALPDCSWHCFICGSVQRGRGTRRAHGSAALPARIKRVPGAQG